MSGKRKADGKPNWRDRKKQKLSASRTIPVQKPSGPSDSMTGLPTSIDTERFTEARAFEINAMEQAMKNASDAPTSRAWQVLPRHLRRRAASHDVRRVPQRLREKAQAEMDPMKEKKKLHKPKLGKDRRLSRAETFLKRQRDKTWLETHIWHAKRMHMENMWGYRLAVTPTEKSFRPSHRASVHGSIVHDASYFSIVQVEGPQTLLVSVLEACCDPQGPSPGAVRFVNGSRVFQSHIYKHASYPFNLLGPVSIIWQSITCLQDDDKEKPVKGKNSKQDKGKEKAHDSAEIPSCRKVWVQVHPAIFDDVLVALRTAATHCLIAARRTSNGSEVSEILLSDLRDKVNIFEIMGPKANQVLKGALEPVSQDKRQPFLDFWSSLGDLQSSGSCPTGMVVGLKILDPRLKFPPSNAKAHLEQGTHTGVACRTTPSPELAASELWEDAVRDKLAKPRYKKKDIDERREKNSIPGSKLNALRQDDRVPCLLVQRSLKDQGTNQSIHGWTLYIPSGWAMAFWPSLIFTGTRVGGQRERQTQAFESGTTYFPRDYPFTDAYEAQIAEREKEEREKWERTPKAKKPNFDKLGMRSPWAPDWDVVLGIVAVSEPASNIEGFTTTQRDAPTTTSTDLPTRHWLLRGPSTGEIVQQCIESQEPDKALLSAINGLRIKRLLLPLEHSVNPEIMMKGALVRVRVKLLGRGAPEDLACLYEISDEDVQAWKAKKGRVEEPGEELASKKYPSDAIIGYVTSGNFSLSRGEYHALAAVPFSKYIQLSKQSTRLRLPCMVAIRNRDGQENRPAHIEVVHD